MKEEIRKAEEAIKALEKVKKIAHYLQRDPVEFMQFDGFANMEADSIVHPDEDADALFSGDTIELMSGGPAVRVLIVAGTKKGSRLTTFNENSRLDWRRL